MLNCYPLLLKDFKEKALNFKKIGKPSVKVLYFSEFDYSINCKYCFNWLLMGLIMYLIFKLGTGMIFYATSATA